MADLNSRVGGYWTDFPVTYRTEQIAEIMQWVNAGESGAVIGSSGTGKSNLAGFLHSRSDAIAPFRVDRLDRYCFLRLDINSLPNLTATFFYRGLVQTLQDASTDLGADVQQAMELLAQRKVNWDDIFDVLTILHKMHHLVIRQAGKKVVWLLDRFDEACKRLDAQTLSSLRSLRDQFKTQLCYVVFTRHPLARLRDPSEFDEFHEIVARNNCWVGPMVERDARWIVRQMAERLFTTFSETNVRQLIEVTGGLPAFMKLGCLALAEGVLEKNKSPQNWAQLLLTRAEFQRNCQEIWDDLSFTEQDLLQLLSAGTSETQVDQASLIYLERVGVLKRDESGQRVRIFSPILATYIARQHGEASGRLELDPLTGKVRRDGLVLDIELTTFENRLLSCFLKHTGEICEKDTLINEVWPDERLIDGSTDYRLTQLIKRLRQKIEPEPARPTYIQNVRGRGYRFVQPGE